MLRPTSICSEIAEEECEWYVVFHEATFVPFWQWLFTLATPVEFGHCFCFAQTGPLVTFIEPTHAAVQIHFKYDEEDLNSPIFAEEYARSFSRLPGWTVVKVKARPWGQANIRHLMNFIPSCVTLVKIVLGEPAPCLTPYAYYKFLIKSGKGEQINGIVSK